MLCEETIRLWPVVLKLAWKPALGPVVVPPPPRDTTYKPVCTWPQERENEGGWQLTADPHSTAAFTVLMTTAGCVVIGMLRRHLSVSVSREKPKNNCEAPPMGGHHTTIRGGE